MDDDDGFWLRWCHRSAEFRGLKTEDRKLLPAAALTVRERLTRIDDMGKPEPCRASGLTTREEIGWAPCRDRVDHRLSGPARFDWLREGDSIAGPTFPVPP